MGRRSWWDSKPAAKKQELYRIERCGSEVITITCLHCGKEVTCKRNKQTPKRKFCSPGCRNAYYKPLNVSILYPFLGKRS